MNIKSFFACTLCVIPLLVACGDADKASDDDDGGSGGSGGATTSASGGGGSGGEGVGAGGMVAFAVTSMAFEEGQPIPLANECGPPLMGPGMNVSPDLTWTAGPSGTASYAVVVRDIDAMIPAFPEGVIHWVLYDIPADVLQLPADVASGYELASPVGAKQAELQGSGYFGYFGMCSPNSVNTYQFTIHAMPEATVPGVTMASSESEVAAAIEATSIAQTSVSGES